MDKDKLKWCGGQKKGVALIEPKEHLSKSYIKESDDTLENVFTSRGKWKVITAYYACYSAVYSILMKCGIRCEIHDCTLELLELLGLEGNDIVFVRSLKEDRIQAQYYLKDVVLKSENDVKKFILACKTVLNSLGSEKIESVRKELEDLIR